MLALQVLEKYCTEHGLSYEKLKMQKFNVLGGILCFSQPGGIIPKGLTNDMETMPKPTLIIKNVNGSLEIEQTEYTEKYLL